MKHDRLSRFIAPVLIENMNTVGCGYKCHNNYSCIYRPEIAGLRSSQWRKAPEGLMLFRPAKENPTPRRAARTIDLINGTYKENLIVNHGYLANK